MLNAINNAKFRHFDQDGQLAGHDNFNYIVSTWQHTFNDEIHTKTEGYFMWQCDAVAGRHAEHRSGRNRLAAAAAIGAYLPGTSLTYGVVNYTMFQLSKKDFITFRNEWWNDERGERSGFPGNYTATPSA